MTDLPPPPPLVRADRVERHRPRFVLMHRLAELGLVIVIMAVCTAVMLVLALLATRLVLPILLH